MDITSCSMANTTSSTHGYNLRKRSVLNYYASPAKRVKTTTSTTAVQGTSSNAPTPRAVAPAKPRKERTRKIHKTAEWTKFPNLVKEEIFEFGDYVRRSKSHSVTNYKSNAHVGQLPNCVLSLIFKILDPLERIKIERVCRRWLYVSRHFSWSSMHALGPEHVAFDEGNHMPADGGWPSYGRRVNHRVSASLPNIFLFLTIWGMNLAQCKFYAELIKDREKINSIVDRSGKYLKTVNFGHLAFLDYKICNVLRLTPRVSHLDLTGVLLTNSSLLTIGSHLPNLKCVVFRRCFNRTQVERGMSRLLQACRELESLDVSDNEHFYARECFEYLPPTLQHLYMAHSYCIGNEAVNGIQRNCRDLRSLVMDRVDKISAPVLNNLFEHLPNLETLQYGECFNNATREEILSIGKLTKLKQLTLFDNVYVSEALLKMVGSNCHDLVKIDLTSSTRRIENQSLQYLASLPNLSVVNLSGMRLLTDQTLCDIANNGRLTEILLSRCQKITDNSIIYMLKKCKQLRVLDVSNCELVTDASMKQIIENLNETYGKTVPPPNTSDSKKFCFWGKHSGVTSPMPKNLTHPWMKIMNEVDYEYMLMGYLINWSNFGHFHHFPWMFGF